MYDGMGPRGQVVVQAEVTKMRTRSGDKRVKEERDGSEDEVGGNVVTENPERMHPSFL